MKHDEQRVLDILKEKEMHGYEIVVRLNSDPENFLNIESEHYIQC